MRHEKKHAFLIPKRGLSLIDFSRCWREIHGPLVASTPLYGHCRRRYAQSHFLRIGPTEPPFRFADMAEVTLASGSGAFTGSTMYRHRIAPDEAKFLDLARSVTITVAEKIVIGGRTDLKLVILSRPAPDLSSQEFSDHLSNWYAGSATGNHEFRYRVRGFRLNQVLDSTAIKTLMSHSDF